MTCALHGDFEGYCDECLAEENQSGSDYDVEGDD